LEGREFICGIADCYTIIRDWYRINKKITLPNYPRDINHWYRGESLYDKYFAHAGFERITIEQADVGDLILIRTANGTTNHGGIYLGENQMLHHLYNRLSGKDSTTRWSRCIVGGLRYKGQE
jgi:cell wall-associated NlpC family hydrolase